MKKLIEDLYDDIYSPKITPEQLINNVTLPNYISVHVESNKIGMYVESKCKLSNGIIAEYTYQFDTSKRLLSLIEYVENQENKLYCRHQEIKTKYDEIKEKLKIYTSVS